jgi:hypothetical protein
MGTPSEDLSTEKLRLEVGELRRKGGWADQLVKLTPLLSVTILVGGFVMSVMQFTEQGNKDRDQRAEAERQRLESEKRAEKSRLEEQAREGRLRERELFKPLWEQQIRLLFEASEVASTLSTSPSASTRAAATERFWILYEGPLCIVESKGVSGAMVALGDCLNKPECRDLRALSKDLATAVQSALVESWQLGLGEFSNGKFQYHFGAGDSVTSASH